MSKEPKCPYHNTAAVLTTMHGKEKVISPVLEDSLGLVVSLATGVNTDCFGTFSREIERTGSQLDAARAKISAGFNVTPWARVGLASEGSFGPHPSIPFVALGRELIVLVDRDRDLELTGYDASLSTNYGHKNVLLVDDAISFALTAGFPDHGVIVMGCNVGKPAPQEMLIKDITDQEALSAAVQKAIHVFGSAFIEADMRAHRNPTRMLAIERATRDLVRKYLCTCPKCAWPGFDITDRIAGLECAWCGEPTHIIKTEILCCANCSYREERPATSAKTAEPGFCDQCNP